MQPSGMGREWVMDASAMTRVKYLMYMPGARYCCGLKRALSKTSKSAPRRHDLVEMSRWKKKVFILS